MFKSLILRASPFLRRIYSFFVNGLAWTGWQSRGHRLLPGWSARRMIRCETGAGQPQTASWNTQLDISRLQSILRRLTISRGFGRFKFCPILETDWRLTNRKGRRGQHTFVLTLQLPEVSTVLESWGQATIKVLLSSSYLAIARLFCCCFLTDEATLSVLFLPRL